MTEQELAAIQADLATLKPRDRVSILTDEQERLLYDTVPTLLGEVARLQQITARLRVWCHEEHTAATRGSSRSGMEATHSYWYGRLELTEELWNLLYPGTAPSIYGVPPEGDPDLIGPIAPEGKRR